MPNPTEIRTEITAKIIAAIEAGTLPWRRPWRVSPNTGVAVNVVSGKPYRGINIILTGLHRFQHGFESKYFATFQQWKALGGTIKKRPDHVQPGQWGCKVVFYKPFTKTVSDPASGEEKERQFAVLRTYTVFCVDQVEGAAFDKYRVLEGPGDGTVLPNFGPADELIAATKADIRFGSQQALYCPPAPQGSWPHHTSGDYVQMPVPGKFNGMGAYYESVLHELAHWSEVRLGWDRKGNGYAAGELVAELGACFLAGELGIPNGEGIENHAAYLKSWLDGMKADANFIFKASSQAAKVADFLMGFVRQAQSQPEAEAA